MEVWTEQTSDSWRLSGSLTQRLLRSSDGEIVPAAAQQHTPSHATFIFSRNQNSYFEPKLWDSRLCLQMLVVGVFLFRLHSQHLPFLLDFTSVLASSLSCRYPHDRCCLTLCLRLHWVWVFFGPLTWCLVDIQSTFRPKCPFFLFFLNKDLSTFIFLNVLLKLFFFVLY